jgi:hypothetical protein
MARLSFVRARRMVGNVKIPPGVDGMQARSRVHSFQRAIFVTLLPFYFRIIRAPAREERASDRHSFGGLCSIGSIRT